MLNKVDGGADIAAIMAEVGRKAKAAAAPLAIASAEQKNKALLAAADAVLSWLGERGMLSRTPEG